MAPPAKRRKRNTIYDSDNDEDDGKPMRSRNGNLDLFLSSSPSKPANISDTPIPESPIRTKKPARASNGAAPRKNGAKTTKASPSKNNKVQKIEPKQSKALTHLFQRQRELAKTRDEFNAELGGSQIEDIISDPISEDDVIAERKSSVTSIVSKRSQKRPGQASQTPSFTTARDTDRFARPPDSTPPPLEHKIEDQRPWSERFAPENLEELCVHKKKVSDVRTWIEDVYKGRLRQRLLVLKGSAGIGKTTTIELLAKQLDIELLAWRNPGSNPGSGNGSQAAQFEEFLGRGGRFNQLDMDDKVQPSSPAESKTASTAQLDDDRKKLITIEEFPAAFLRSGSALAGFRRTILDYLEANTPSLGAFRLHANTEPIIPIIMIISETLLTTTSASADTFTAHRLLGPEILSHPGTAVIPFNDIAPTLMLRALQTIVQKEARKTGRRKTPGLQILKRLAELGDVRNAVANLEFLCLKGDQGADWSGRVAPVKGKKALKEQPLTKDEEQSLQLLSQREASLGIFHAVGKIVYNKREEQPFAPGSEAAEAEEMPEWLTGCARPKKSEVNIDALMDETGADISTFIATLHENYVLSCAPSSATDPRSAADYTDDCIEYLSQSDLLNPSWDTFFGGRGLDLRGRDQGSHVLRQDEMAFQLAVRGLLFSLPSPVRRQGSSLKGGRGGGDAFKMFYPSSIKLWKVKEELEGLVDLWSLKLLEGERKPAKASQQPLSELMKGSSVFNKPNKPGMAKTKTSSVGDWAGNRTEKGYAAKVQAAKAAALPLSTPGEDEQPLALLCLGSAARKEMLLDRLPYMALVARRQRQNTSTTLRHASLKPRDLERIVFFEGIGAPQTEDANVEGPDVQGEGAETWATDKPGDGPSSPRKKSVRDTTLRAKEEDDDSQGSKFGRQLDKLVLSDDDIED